MLEAPVILAGLLFSYKRTKTSSIMERVQRSLTFENTTVSASRSDELSVRQ